MIGEMLSANFAEDLEKIISKIEPSNPACDDLVSLYKKHVDNSYGAYDHNRAQGVLEQLQSRKK